MPLHQYILTATVLLAVTAAASLASGGAVGGWAAAAVIGLSQGSDSKGHDGDDKSGGGGDNGSDSGSGSCTPSSGATSATGTSGTDCEASDDDAQDHDNLRMASGLPVNGWWWDPSHNGQGFAIEIHNARLFLGAFVYDSTGKALWVTSTRAMTDSMTYSGQLIAFQGGPTLDNSTRSPRGLGTLGTVTIDFTSSTTATLTMPDCTTYSIERFSIVKDGAAQSWDSIDQGRPTTGWYWNPKQSGRGFFVENQGDRLFMVAFMYRDDGSPVWYAANDGLLPGTAERSFSGDLYEYQSSTSAGRVSVAATASDSCSGSGGTGTGGTGTGGTGTGATGLDTSSVSAFQDIGSSTIQFLNGHHASVTMPTGEVIDVQRFRF